MLDSCDGSGAQQWRAGTGDRLVNPASGKCLADPAGSTRNGKQVQIRSCTGQSNQKWMRPAGPVVSELPGKCLDDSNNGTASAGTPVDLFGMRRRRQAGLAGKARRRAADPPQVPGRHRIGRRARGTGGAAQTAAASGLQQWHMTADRGGINLLNRSSGTMPG